MVNRLELYPYSSFAQYWDESLLASFFFISSTIEGIPSTTLWENESKLLPLFHNLSTTSWRRSTCWWYGYTTRVLDFPCDRYNTDFSFSWDFIQTALPIRSIPDYWKGHFLYTIVVNTLIIFFHRDATITTTRTLEVHLWMIIPDYLLSLLRHKYNYP